MAAFLEHNKTRGNLVETRFIAATAVGNPVATAHVKPTKRAVVH